MEDNNLRAASLAILFSSFSSLSHTPPSSLPHPQQVLKILKPLVIYSSFLTTLSHSSVFMRQWQKMKKSFPGARAWLCLRLSVNVYQGKSRSKKREKKQIVKLPSLVFSRSEGMGMVGGEGGGEVLMFFLFNVSVLSFLLLCLALWREATRRCGCVMGFSFWGGWGVYHRGTSQVFFLFFFFFWGP